MAEAAKDTRTLECDLVMKGGITSGIVYPGAIARIATQYRLRNIGGTSAGAIAAAAAAAMEYGISIGLESSKAIEKLKNVTADLAQKTDQNTTTLQALFTAEPGTQRLLGALLSATKSGFLAGLLRFGRDGAIVAAIVAVVTSAWLLGQGQHLAAVLMAGVGIFAVLFLAALFFMLRASLSAWVNNGFGMSSGKAVSGAKKNGKDVPSLIEWLHEQIQSLAGLPNGPALTFGHLWNPTDPANASTTGPRQIDLVLVTSDLNQLLSANFPFLPQDERLFIDSEKWKELFPKSVIEAIKPHAWPHKQPHTPFPAKTGFTDYEFDMAVQALGLPKEQIWRLPKAQHIPILVAVRASMAFPGLFTPLPLLLLRRVPDGQNGSKTVFSEILLSDGGITSNFPIHLFDAPLPNRPTFALNLVYDGEEVGVEGKPVKGADEPVEPSESDEPVRALSPAGDINSLASLADLFMPMANNSRIGFYKQPSTGTPVSLLSGFLFRIIETARVWGDVSLFDQPGTRDRIIHIRLAKNEGGFNLDMDQSVIKRLAEKGDLAGNVLANRFDPADPSDPLDPNKQPVILNWHNHRFLRFRAYLAAQQLAAIRFDSGWKHANETQLPQSNPALDALTESATGSFPNPSNPSKPEFHIGYSSELSKPQRDHLRFLTNAMQCLLPLTNTNAAYRSPEPRSLLKLRPAGHDPRATKS